MPDEAMNAALQFITESQRQSNARVAESFDVTPDDAARAYGHEKTFGVPASTIVDDVDGFEKEHKTVLTNGVIGYNQFLNDYINSHPMHAPISQNDWPKLDDLSKKVQGFGALGVLGAM